VPGSAEVRLLFVFEPEREAIVLVAGDKAARERSRAEQRAEQRGYQLAQLRKNTGLTQAQVAAMMGVSISVPGSVSTSVP
jgi:DNA-binding transcriptional regulator YiaG